MAETPVADATPAGPRVVMPRFPGEGGDVDPSAPPPTRVLVVGDENLLFAYRTQLFVFHVIRHAKLVLKSEGHLHLVWPEETSLMASPCGASGLELPQLMGVCGCKPTDAQLEMEKVSTGFFWPFLFGEVPKELPDWLSGVRITSFSIGKEPIAVPLSTALLLHPDVGFVSVKGGALDSPAGPSTPLRPWLAKEAVARRERLRELYAHTADPEHATDAYGLVPEPFDEDALLSIPMEIFMVSFDDVPHISLLLKFQICDAQPQVSIASLDVLDPRLPTRISRPPPVKDQQREHQSGSSLTGKKRKKPAPEEWGGMKFYCPLTKIYTASAEKMRLHMSGELYKRLAASTLGWKGGADEADMLFDIEEAEAIEEQAKKKKKYDDRNRDSNRNDRGKGSRGKGK